MTMAHEFEYVRPAELKEALALLAQPTPGGNWPLCGGSDLITWIRDGAIRPGCVVDVKEIPELKGIRRLPDGLWVGAAVPFSDLLDSPLVQKIAPVLVEAAGMVASVGVRNRATPVGNICSAVPCCDSGPALLVYGASLRIATMSGSRWMPIGKWFLGPRRTALPHGALVTGIRIPMERHAGAFAKLKRYRGEDLAQASVAVRVTAAGDWRVAFGSVAPVPIRGLRTERVLRGVKAPDAALLSKAAAVAESEVAPITDIRASAEYRRLMIGVMLERAAALAAERLAGRGAPYGVNVIEEDV